MNANAGDRVSDDISFSFFSNVVVICGAFIWLKVAKYGHVEKAAKVRNVISLRFKLYGIIFFIENTVCANMATLLQMRLLERMDVSVIAVVI